MAQPDFKQQLDRHSYFPVNDSPAEFEAFLKSDIESNAALLKSLDVKN
jgi:tripartite-type tricarboxylate transporter receptor subunit TctC